MVIELRCARPEDVGRILRDEKEPADRSLIDHWSKKQHLEAIDNEATIYWVIVHDGAPVGHLIVQNLDDPNDSAFLRRIVVTLPRSGVGKAAVSKALDYLFRIKKLHRIWLNVKQGNTASAEFFSALGFVQEGTSREASKIGDSRYVSMDVFSMLVNEFEGDA